MKILILANNDVGLFNFRKELIETLVKKNKVYISLPYGELVDNFKKIGCCFINTVFSRHGTNPIDETKLLLHYIKIMRKVKPDIVLSYTIKPNIYGGIACQVLHIPYVVNITGLGTAVENPGIMQKISVNLYKIGLRSAQKVFFQNSENQKFMLDRRVVKGAYSMLPGSGVNLENYTVLDYPDGDTIDFVFIGRIMKEKGIDQYLEAARCIRNKYPYTRFHICGTCEEDYIETLDNMQEKGIVIYHGQVKDIKEIHEICHCTVHPTYYPEGLSNVLLESCACGRPIITTNRSGCREVVENGVNGYIVEQKNTNDLIWKIEKFLALSHEERKAMGLAGRVKVEKEFDRRIVIRKYLQELKKNEKNIK